MEKKPEKGNLTKQYLYCSFCHLNHKKWKKHIYSKRHQEIMQNILDKFSIKVKSARDSIKFAHVEEPSFERDAKVWCYFCSEDVDKHTHAETYTLLYGAFIDHLSSDNHLVMTNKFLHSNLLDKDRLNDFVFDAIQLKSFMENASKAVAEFEMKKNLQLSRDAAIIRGVEERRHQTIKKWQCESEGQMMSDSTSFRAHSLPEKRKRKVVRASGEGVTSILQPNDDHDEGNIFSGALPPWLRQDTETQPNSNLIGPTKEDFQKHLEKEKKGKLPANRVGADFDHTSATSQQWLPSFGRVWSKGRRLQSKNFFEKQTGPRKKKVYSADPQRIDSDKLPPSRSLSVKPYQKKRTTATISNPYTANNSNSMANTSGVNSNISNWEFSQEINSKSAIVKTFQMQNTQPAVQVETRDFHQMTPVNLNYGANPQSKNQTNHVSTMCEPYYQGHSRQSASKVAGNGRKADFKTKQPVPLPVPYKRKRTV